MAGAIVPIAKARIAKSMAESRNPDHDISSECCGYHVQAPVVGHCTECKAAYCASCAVAHPGQEHSTLCLNCGTALFIKTWRRALVFAFAGALLGLWLPLRLHYSPEAEWTMTATCGYGGWALCYGWHYGAEAWRRWYERLRQALRYPAPCLAILVIIRPIAALLIGACGGGLRLCLRTLRLRQKQRSLKQE